MPEYLGPGVFIEETSFRARSIEGVSTSVAGFVGQTRFGPVERDGEILTNLADYERVYGDHQHLRCAGATRHNYMWHAARAFFAEGGRRLHVSRVFRRIDDLPTRPTPYLGFDESCVQAPYGDGHARGALGGSPGASGAPRGFELWARHPGAAGNLRVQLTLTTGKSVLVVRKVLERSSGGQEMEREVVDVTGLEPRDVVLVTRRPGAPEWATARGPFYLASRELDGSWTVTESPNGSGSRFPLGRISPSEAKAGLELRVVKVDLAVQPTIGTGQRIDWTGLALDPAHEVTGVPDSLRERLRYDPAQPEKNREVPVLIRDAPVTDGLTLLRALLDAGASNPVPLEVAIQASGSSRESRTVGLDLGGGNDGQEPQATEFEGREGATTAVCTGLKRFERIRDISIVAAPGASYAGTPPGGPGLAEQVAALLISHCERMRYRIALLDGCNGMTISQIREMRAKLDSKHGALYYPWVKVLDPATGQSIPLPPSGFVAGIYARTDEQRGVFKAPANEVVSLAVGFETVVDKAQQEVLNPEGINAFRFFEGRGNRLWGARTISSDPEWKYVNIRRYFSYLERSIDQGTQWAVFEPNGEPLWGNVKRTVEDFLLNEWKAGALLGDKPEKAFFVRCDRSTMTQNDLDNGRLICLVGVAPLKPAEFVIFRVGQWTADHQP